MLKKNIRKALISIVYFTAIMMVVLSFVFIGRIITNDSPTNDKKYIYVMRGLIDKDLPVVGKNQTMLKPFTNNNVKIVRGFYNYLDDREKQENALIYHEKTYMQNTGIDFGGVNNFEIIAVLDGNVISVEEEALLGKTIEIRHSNELISVYQSLSEVLVKNGDSVIRGQVIGKSGLSNISADLKDHLHFELFHKGQVVNPLDYFDKKIE